MATTIAGNLVTVVPITYTSNGNTAPAPSGDTVTVQNDNGAAIDARVEEDGNHNRSLVLTPTQPPQAATANITVTDVLANGTTLVTTAEAFTIEANSHKVTGIHLQLDHITTRPLPSRGGARVVIGR